MPAQVRHFPPVLRLVVRLILPIAPALLFLGLFYVYPLAEVLRISFTPSALSQGATPWAALAETNTLRVITFSFGQAIASTGLTLLLGLPIAHVFARYRFAGRAFWQAVATLPFVMPTVVVAAAFEALLGGRGLLNTGLQNLLNLAEPPIQLMNTLTIILIAHVFYNISIVIRVVGTFWALLNPQIEEAAAALGANRWQVFWHIRLAGAGPAIGAAATLIFIFTFTSFGTILLLGGPRFATLEVEIYNQTAQLLRLDIATSLALLQLAVTLLMGLVAARLQARASGPMEGQRLIALQPARTRSDRAVVFGSLAVIALLQLAPLLTLVLRSLAWDGAGLFRFYLALGENARGSFFFVPPLIAIRNSVGIAALTATLALGLSLPLAYVLTGQAYSNPFRHGKSLGSRMRGSDDRFTWLEALLLLPLGTSALTLGLGYLVAFQSWPALRTSPILLPLAHTLIALPFVVRTLTPALRSVPVAARESAALLGASPSQVWFKIDLPLLLRPLLTALIFAFAISLGEFGASVLIARPDYPTMPLVIARFLGQPGALNYGQALAMSVILMGVTVGVMALIESGSTPSKRT